MYRPNSQRSDVPRFYETRIEPLSHRNGPGARWVAVGVRADCQRDPLLAMGCSSSLKRERIAATSLLAEM